MLMKRGFSFIELVLTLLVVSLVLVIVFESFTSINRLLNKAYSKLVAVTDLSHGTLALWFFGDITSAADYTTSTNFTRDDDIFNELLEDGVSEEVIERFEESVDFWVLDTENAPETYIAVRPLRDWK